MLYKVTSFYDAEAESGIRWDDKTFNIDWPVKDPILSERDLTLERLASS